MSRPWRIAALALVTAVGCGGGQTQGGAFDSRWAYDGGKGIAAVQEKLAQEPIPRGIDVAVGIVDDDDGRTTLVGATLTGGEPWTFAHSLDSRPVIAGTVVVGLGGQELFALEAATGKLLWQRKVRGRLRAAGDDGQTTVVSLEPRTGRGSVLLAIDHDGEVLRQIEDAQDIGAPAVVGRYAFLPWQGQYVTVHDLQRGEEVARALLRTEVSRAFTLGGAVFFAGAAATRLDGQIRRGAEGEASTVSLPSRELPGMPRWISPGTEVLPPEASALDKTRIYARPAVTGPAAIEGGHHVATYFRVALGFDARTGEIAWATTNEADFLGGAAYAGGFALCDARGDVTFLDVERGAPSARMSLGRPLRSCVVQADGIKVTARSRVEPLWRQLDRVVSLRDAELVNIQRFLLRELAALADEEVTGSLINLASDARAAPALVEDARRLLAGRRAGPQYLLAALERRFDYLAGAVNPPPVGPMAEAVAAMKERQAAPLLVRHLLDPATPPADLERVAAALATLAGPAELPALKTFFAMYRGVEDDATSPAAARVAEALLRLGAADVVTRAAADPWTTPALRERIAALVRSAPSAGR